MHLQKGLSGGNTFHFSFLVYLLLFQFSFFFYFFFVFTTFTPLAIFSYRKIGLYMFLVSLPGIGAVHFLSLEVDILKNGLFANLGNFYFYFYLFGCDLFLCFFFVFLIFYY